MRQLCTRQGCRSPEPPPAAGAARTLAQGIRFSGPEPACGTPGRITRPHLIWPCPARATMLSRPGFCPYPGRTFRGTRLLTGGHTAPANPPARPPHRLRRRSAGEAQDNLPKEIEEMVGRAVARRTSAGTALWLAARAGGQTRGLGGAWSALPSPRSRALAVAPTRAPAAPVPHRARQQRPMMIPMMIISGGAGGGGVAAQERPGQHNEPAEAHHLTRGKSLHCCIVEQHCVLLGVVGFAGLPTPTHPNGA